jgi:uncharacterized protein (DUF433 family)
MFESRDLKIEVREWVLSQPKCPSRKEVKKVFPEVPLKHIRAAIQSRKDRADREVK